MTILLIVVPDHQKKAVRSAYMYALIDPDSRENPVSHTMRSILANIAVAAKA